VETPILIPVFHPGSQLVALIEQLVKGEVPAVVIVDNGNSSESQPIFERCATHPKVHVVRRGINIGKGAGLKTGITYILNTFPASPGLVIADADGQHDPDDILRIARSVEQNPDCLILGFRQFDKRVPLRSRFGNLLTLNLTRIILGQRVRDSQCGLRGIPRKLLTHIPSLTSNGYEFELEMLIASKHLGIRIIELSIQTIYELGNPTSHFDPIRDSMRIYFVLFRFSLIFLLTVVLDCVVFAVVYMFGAGVLAAQLIGLSTAVLFNYRRAIKAVFLSHERYGALFLRYILLVLASGAVSYGLIQLMNRLFTIEVILAKLTAESLLFMTNFVLQRDFIFSSHPWVKSIGTEYPRAFQKQSATVELQQKATSVRHDGTGQAMG
jgi:glycosyltransferase involved in cell wall biosynthesis